MMERTVKRKSGRYEWRTQLMRDRLVNIITSVSYPRMHGDVQIGEWSIPQLFAEKIANELIDNGVIVPTFKVGDIVWVYDCMWGIIPCEIDRPYHCRCGNEGACTFEMSFSEADIGDYIFATKEDAEVYWHGVPEVSGKMMYLD